MNILFLSISSLPHLSEHSISLDLIHEFQKNGHQVYVVSAIEKKAAQDTNLSQEAGCTILRVKIGNNKRANLIEKGLTTLFLPEFYISAIKKYLDHVKFDLVLYPTPPVTQGKTVTYIKKRDGAGSYLLLKDIFPQNAVDIGMLQRTGFKGLIYRYFKKQEKKLYEVSDYIGCMSPANVSYLLRENPQIKESKVEVCPNSIEIQDMRLPYDMWNDIRRKYGIPTEKKVFVYGGNLGRPQGIPFLMECLKAQALNKDAFFLIVGDGSEYNKLEAFLKNEKLTNAKLLKRLPKNDYDRLVSACDVGMIFLDHRFTIPNFPSRLLGYMQAGVPVLAVTDPNSDIGPVIEENGFGWWCESNSAENFSSLVNRFMTADRDSMQRKEWKALNELYASSDAYKTIMKHF